MRVALVHYWLNGMRGGERVLETFAEMFPDADIFTHVVDRSKLSETLNRHTIHTSFISRLPFANRHYQKYLPFMPRALEELDLSEYDLVISSESGPAKGVITKPGSFHLCYCHSPMRYIWDQYHHYHASAGWPAKILFPGIAHRLRTWDVASAARVDRFVANSNFVAKRIEKFYRRESDVIFPPVAVDEFSAVTPDEGADYFLAAGELVGYKRFDLVVDAFNELGLKLIIVGDGEERAALEKKARDNITFLGRVPFAELKRHFASCKALIFPGEEDFGMIPVEVMAAGKPVIAYGRGGALDTVVPGVSGILVNEQSVAAFVSAIERFDPKDFSREQLIEHAQTFSKAVFKSKIRTLLSEQGIELNRLEVHEGGPATPRLSGTG
ncbi:glycosyltransferase [Henriciella pelagia]|jgi:glycosyltransferase involved in cell wall biosynthesis|uniref:Glycosyl transferase n=1 Tax=Henriciella pelagia TaxID=1977912 RepID=A0ABQ1JJL0_9PROT|nr:glycosyltransferase [Henriciella pelagia]GGB67976.1 glycosyl transferase [Henriciella pelagia]